MRPPFAFQGVVNTAPRTGRTGPTDLRRAIPRPVWLAERARNALHRPAFIGVVSIATFAVAVLSLIVVPRAQRQADAPLPTFERPDTLSLAAQAALARARLLEADSALVAARTEAQQEQARRDAEIAAALAADTLIQARRDSLAVHVAALDAMIGRAQQAPLASSYRALAELQVLRGDTRVRALVDSLSEIERERDGFGAVGGVDPIYVALTSRANDIGKTILAIAQQRRDTLEAQIGRLGQPVVTVSQAEPLDTLRFITFRDSARVLLDSAQHELARRREVSRRVDVEEREARRRATEVAPTMALVTAAFVLAAVFGFGAAFAGELRRPRVSTPSELERFLGVRVLATVGAPRRNAERRRRRFDQTAPDHLDPSATSYQLAYLALATEHPAQLTVTVTGDDPVVTAVVAANLAAVATEEARTTLLLETDPARRATAALGAKAAPGLSEIDAGDSSWPDTLNTAPVGRDRSIDFIPPGSRALDASAISTLFADNGARLSRYYDAIVLVASLEQVTGGVPASLPSSEVIFCAQAHITPMRELREALDRVRAAGGTVRGLVLWTAERPRVTAAALPARARHVEREHVAAG